MLAIYVIGAPGSGKSTLLRALGDQLGNGERVQYLKPVPHVDLGRGWVEVGKDRGSFSGTDALGYAAQPAAIAWITSESRPERLLGEGDRLCHHGFLDALGQHYARQVIFLNGPGPSAAVAWARVERRASRLGVKPQNHSWWSGRLTKARNFARHYRAAELDMRAPVEENVARICELVDIPTSVG